MKIRVWIESPDNASFTKDEIEEIKKRNDVAVDLDKAIIKEAKQDG